MQRKKKQFSYKGKPLYRVGNTLYYGDLNEKYIMQFDITETKKVKELDAAANVKLKLISNTGADVQVYRQSERQNLYQALDLGAWWLKTALVQN